MRCLQSEMTNRDLRCAPLIAVEFEQLQTLLAPVLQGASITGIERAADGLVNTVYRVLTTGGAFGLRLFAHGRRVWEAERNILAQVAAALPVPEVLLAGAGEAEVPHPYLVCRWIEGITLNECRRQMPPAALLSLAEPLGRLLATVAGLSSVARLVAAPTEMSSVPAALAASERDLQCGLARERLGAALADALRRSLEARAARLIALDGDCLVHGDLGGRNILVAPTAGGDWRVSGLIDWENAFSGSLLWDVGSLFRYAGRYAESFRQGFERGYGAAGGMLPEDWWRSARLLDATRLVTLFNDEPELPVVFAECRELCEAVVADCG